MILDTSALLAVLFDEADADHYEHTIGDATACRMSVANYLEAILVIESRLGEEGGRELDNYMEAAEIGLVSVTPEQVQAARLAWRRYGKGNHPQVLTSVTASLTRSQKSAGNHFSSKAKTSLSRTWSRRRCTNPRSD